MTFARPEWLWVLALLPVLFALALSWARSRARDAESFGGARARVLSIEHRDSLRFLSVFVLVVIAASGPLVGVAPRRAQTAGVDVVVALDVSRSMWVEDVGESRIDRARREIRSFVRELAAGRVALVSFSGEAEILCPKTSDRFGFESRLADAVPDARPGSGTSLVRALETSLALFEPGDDRTRVVVIASDGESRDDPASWREAIAKARTADVIVHALLVGSSEGGPVPESGKTDARFVTGEDGPVISRADPRRLLEATRATGGTLMRDRDDPDSWAMLARSMSMDVGGVGEWQVLAPVDRYRWLILVALALLWPRGTRGEPNRPNRSVARAIAVIPLALAFGGVQEAWRDALSSQDAGDLDVAIERYREALALVGDDDASGAAIEFDLAIALLRRGDLELAEAEFVRVATRTEFGGDARHGAGLAAARAAERERGTPREIESLRRARAMFLEALRVGAGTASAANLEYVTRRLADLESGGEDGSRADGGSEGSATSSDGKDPRTGDRSGGDRSTSRTDDPAESGPTRATTAEGPVAGEVGGEAREPTARDAVRRLRHDEIEAIVAEFERRRIEYDRSRASRGRAPEPFDW